MFFGFVLLSTISFGQSNTTGFSITGFSIENRSFTTLSFDYKTDFSKLTGDLSPSLVDEFLPIKDEFAGNLLNWGEKATNISANIFLSPNKLNNSKWLKYSFSLGLSFIKYSNQLTTGSQQLESYLQDSLLGARVGTYYSYSLKDFVSPDSIYTESQAINYSVNDLQLNLAWLFSVNESGYFSPFATIGTGLGVSVKSKMTYIEEGRFGDGEQPMSSEPAVRSFTVNDYAPNIVSSKNETFRPKASFTIAPFASLGINMRISKKGLLSHLLLSPQFEISAYNRILGSNAGNIKSLRRAFVFGLRYSL